MKTKYLIAAIAGGLLSFTPLTSFAATRTWNNAGTDFNTGANWTGGLPGAADNATFTGAAGVNQPNLSANITIQGLTFSSLTSSGYSLTRTAGSLTLTNVGVTANSAINAANTSGTNTISAPIILGGAAATTATFTQTAGGTLAISGDISSTNAITGLSLAGNNGNFILSGNNSYTGGTTLANVGIKLSISNNNAISSGALTMAFGTATIEVMTNDLTLANQINGPAGTAAIGLTFSGAQNLTLNGLLNVNYGGVLTNDIGAGKLLTLSDLNLATGGIASNRSLSIAGSGDTTITGIIADGHAPSAFIQSLSISNTGITTISGISNTYTGSTTIASGATVVVESLANGGSNSSLGVGTGVTINGGTLKYTGAGSSSNRAVVIGATGLATIDASGSGALDLTSTSAIGAAGNTLTLTGSNTGNNTFGQRITNTTNLQKTGIGSWALTNTTTNATGSVSVSAGTLIISGAGTINTVSGVAVSGSTAKLRYDSSVALSRDVTVTSGGTFAYNSSGNYTGNLTLTNGKLGGTNWNGAKLGGLTIGANQAITPGNSVGTAVTTTQTWANAGSYDWEINKADGIAGDVSGGWDLLNLSGALTISATSGTPFTINIISLGLNNLSGLATGFSSGSNYNWLLADAGAAVATFSADKFILNSGSFQNSFSGTFGIELGNTGSLVGIGDSSQLYLTYTAVPEPGTWVLLAATGAFFMLKPRRRRA